MSAPAPADVGAGTVDLALPSDAELMAAATPDPRTEVARLTTAGDPAQIGTVGRELGEGGLAMDEVYGQSRAAQQALAASFANDGTPVYDETTHWSALPGGFRDTGTRLHDAGRRLAVVADALTSATTEVTGRLDRLGVDLNAWRSSWAAEVAATRGPGSVIPLDQVPRLQARRADVIAGMQEAATACGQTVAARVGRYNEVLADCVRLLGDPGPAVAPGPGPVPLGPFDTSGLRPGALLVPGATLEGSSIAPPPLPTPGFAPAPQGPSILINPVPDPLPGLPGFTLPPVTGPLINVPAPDLGTNRNNATGAPDAEPNPGARPPNLAPEGAGREGAFGQAKRDSGIPVGMPPTRVVPNLDKREQIQPGRVYEYDLPAPGGGVRTVRIRDDAGGHEFPDDPSQNRGPHFNTDDGGHYDY